MERTTRFEPATLTLARYADLFRRLRKHPKTASGLPF